MDASDDPFESMNPKENFEEEYSRPLMREEKIGETVEGFDAALMNYTSRFDFRKDNSRVWKSSYEKKGKSYVLTGLEGLIPNKYMKSHYEA